MSFPRWFALGFLGTLVACAADSFSEPAPGSGGASGETSAGTGGAGAKQGGAGGAAAGSTPGGQAGQTGQAGLGGQGGDAGQGGQGSEGGQAGMSGSSGQGGGPLAGQAGSAGLGGGAGQGGTAGQGGSAGQAGKGGSGQGGAAAGQGGAAGMGGPGGAGAGGAGQGGGPGGGTGGGTTSACGAELCNPNEACVKNTCQKACDASSWYDLSEHGHHGALVNQPTWEGDGTPAKPYALRLQPNLNSSLHGYVDVADASNALAPMSLTAELWVRPELQSDSVFLLHRRAAIGNPTGYILSLRPDSALLRWSSRVAIYTNNPNSDYFPNEDSLDPIATPQWTHLVMRVAKTSDALITELYVDGAVKTQDMVGSKNIYYSQLASSTRVGQANSLFAGTIGLVRFWTSALSDKQIQNLYNANAARFGRLPAVSGVAEPPPLPELHYEAAKCQ